MIKESADMLEFNTEEFDDVVVKNLPFFSFKNSNHKQMTG